MRPTDHSSLITDFSVHVAPRPEGGTEIMIFGELDLATEPDVREAVDQALAADGDVVIDLRACGFVDSRGVALLAQAAIRLQREERALVLRGVQERVARTFHIAGLDTSPSITVEPQRHS